MPKPKIKRSLTSKSNGQLPNDQYQSLLGARRKDASKNADEIPGLAGRSYSGSVAPRVGGPAQKSIGMAQGTAKKANIKKALKNIGKTSASKQAKAAARRAYKGGL